MAARSRIESSPVDVSSINIPSKNDDGTVTERFGGGVPSSLQELCRVVEPHALRGRITALTRVQDTNSIFSVIILVGGIEIA